MDRKNIDNKLIALMSMAGFAILLAVWVLVGIFQKSSGMYDYVISDRWTCYKDNTLICENACIDDISFGKLPAFTEIDMQVPVSEELNGGYTIELLVYLSSVEAYIDDKCIYSYGTDLVGTNQMVGSGYHFIDLPDEVAGSTLRLHFVTNENNAFGSITAPKCAKTDRAYIAFGRYQLVSVLVGISLLGLGVILTIVSLIATFYDRIFVRIIYIGVFSVLMGMWTLFNSKVALLFIEDRILCTNLEYISLYFAPVPFAYLLTDMRRDSDRIRHNTCIAVSIISSVFGIAALFLHFSNIARLPVLLPIFHIVAFACMIPLVILGFVCKGKRSTADSITAIAVFILIFILGLDIIRFNLQKYFLTTNEILMNSLIPFGTVVFVVMLLISYLAYLYDMFMSKTEKETLTRLAYMDILTGLYNRTKYEEVIGQLEESEADFAIISFDVNGLKYINDTYGHSSGDLLLKSFGSILKKNFADIATCFRKGGDEYVVIIYEANLACIDMALSKLALDEIDISSPLDFDVRASYGVAYRHEVEDGQPSKVFTMADKRMYEMKTSTKTVSKKI